MTDIIIIIDYAMCTMSLIQHVMNFSVEERTESDHLPILITFEGQQDVIFNTPSNDNTDMNFLGYKIPADHKHLFTSKLSDILTNTVIREMCFAIDNDNLDINIIMDMFLSIFRQAGEDFKKKPKKVMSDSQPWFDSELKRLKKEKYKQLRQFRQSRSNEDLNTYLRARNGFKNMTKTKKDQYHQNKLDYLLSSVNDSKSFWSKLKYMTGRKVRQINNITTEDWLEHFETLFNDGFEIDADNDIDGNDFDITLDEPNDGVEDHLFNSCG